MSEKKLTHGRVVKIQDFLLKDPQMKPLVDKSEQVHILNDDGTPASDKKYSVHAINLTKQILTIKDPYEFKKDETLCLAKEYFANQASATPAEVEAPKPTGRKKRNHSLAICSLLYSAQHLAKQDTNQGADNRRETLQSLTDEYQKFNFVE